MFKPKHTFESVAERIAEDLDRNLETRETKDNHLLRVGSHSRKTVTIPNIPWSRVYMKPKRIETNVLTVCMGLSLVGIIIAMIPSCYAGMQLGQLPTPVDRIIESLGVALFIAGTVSLGVDTFLRKRTESVYREQITGVLKETAQQSNQQLKKFLDSFIVELQEQTEGIHEEAASSHIRMLYSKREHAFDDIKEAILDAAEFVHIMGVSCREFFHVDTPCSEALEEAFAKDLVDFKVLILDKNCPEALDRSRREQGVDYESIDDERYNTSSMVYDTTNTLQTIQRHFSGPRMSVRVYDRLSLFLLITDKVAFMEPYHYGDRGKGSRLFRRAAELVPLIAFNRSSRKGPYDQFLGHFTYVFENIAKVPGESHGIDTNDGMDNTEEG